MKRISCNLFFSVLWRGFCQALGWFFGLFGYKRDGRFARCVWGVFALSGAVIALVLALAAGTAAFDMVEREYNKYRYYESYDGEYVSRSIGFVRDYKDGDGYLLHRGTREKLLKGVEWIANPLGNDTLVCYSDGKLRGYFSKNTGKVIIKPQFKHAWVFSDGLASVEVDGKILFIDGTGKVVIDRDIRYDGSNSGYVFHGGYCIVYGDTNEKVGLMDRSGEWVFPIEYDHIYGGKDFTFWEVAKEGLSTVYDAQLNEVLTTDGHVRFTDDYIDVTMKDHTQRKYDYAGKLVYDFCVYNVRSLEYETDELYYTEESYTDDEGQLQKRVSEHRKMAVAKRRAYSSGGYEGLMTAEGKMVTLPLYYDIQAIGEDTYLCLVGNGDNVVIDGKGNLLN